MFRIATRHYSIPSTIRTVDLVDLCIVGGGPAGLATAIKFKQMDKDSKYRVVVLEKAADFGNHTVSGCVLDPRSLNELFPQSHKKDQSLRDLLTPVTKDDFQWLINSRLRFPVPIPNGLRNKGRNYICSLSQLTHWLSEQAEQLGVELYPGVSVANLVFNKSKDTVLGVITNDMGLDKEGNPKDGLFEPGMQFQARQTVVAEGCRGSLSKQLINHFKLYQSDTKNKIAKGQTYGLGIKEVWKVNDDNFKPGFVSHTMGYPLSYNTYGGGFQYHFGDNLVTVGLVIGLDYQNPYLNPYQEFQKMKHHPFYEKVLQGGKCLSYAARALNEGGWQSLPERMTFPGGLLVGDSVGYMNVPKIKGTHTAMKSGIIAAEEIFNMLNAKNIIPMESLLTESEAEGLELDSENITSFIEKHDGPSITRPGLELQDYHSKIKDSWIGNELYQVRNIRPAFNSVLGLYGGMMYSGLDTLLMKGKVPWTFQHHLDSQGKFITDSDRTGLAKKYRPIKYGKPDNIISFDIMTSISRTGTYHDHNEPCHLRVNDSLKNHAQKSLPQYDGVEARYCPAGVYEYDKDGNFLIHSQNCIHCKTCDIKDPTGDTQWTVPEGGDGPKYSST